MGRPLKYQTVQELDAAINGYFDNTPKEEWTWTGLALYLDTTRQTLIDYKHREDFTDSIKKGLARVENGYEIDLKKYGRSGTIFALKNFDWRDKNETDITTQGKPLAIPDSLYAKYFPDKSTGGDSTGQPSL